FVDVLRHVLPHLFLIGRQPFIGHQKFSFDLSRCLPALSHRLTKAAPVSRRACLFCLSVKTFECREWPHGYWLISGSDNPGLPLDDPANFRRSVSSGLHFIEQLLASVEDVGQLLAWNGRIVFEHFLAPLP